MGKLSRYHVVLYKVQISDVMSVMKLLKVNLKGSFATLKAARKNTTKYLGDCL